MYENFDGSIKVSSLLSVRADISDKSIDGWPQSFKSVVIVGLSWR